MNRIAVSFYVEPRDAWVGLYWDRPKTGEVALLLYFCLLPFLVIKVAIALPQNVCKHCRLDKRECDARQNAAYPDEDLDAMVDATKFTPVQWP